MVKGSGTINLIVAAGAATIATGGGAVARIVAVGEIARVSGNGGVNERGQK